MSLVQNPVKDNSIIGFTVKKTMYNDGSEINETSYITGQTWLNYAVKYHILSKQKYTIKQFVQEILMRVLSEKDSTTHAS